MFLEHNSLRLKLENNFNQYYFILRAKIFLLLKPTYNLTELFVH